MLVPVVDRNEPAVLLTLRTELPSHPGQIAFPGGKIEPDDRTPADAARYGSDRLFVYLGLTGEKDAVHENTLAKLEAAGHPVVRIALTEIADIGQEFFRWEVAIAAAGAAIGIQPFNQPDVQLAKDLAREAMKKSSGDGKASSSAPEVDGTNLSALRAAIDPWLKERNLIGKDPVPIP